MDKIDFIKKQYKSLANHCELRPLEITIPADGFLAEDFFLQNIAGQGITHIYICFASESLSLKTAVHFRQNITDSNIPIIFRTLNANDYNQFFKKVTQEAEKYKNLHAFPLIACDCCLDRMFYHGIEERIAMNIHHQYCAHETRKGKSSKDNPSLVPWSELHEDLKESNRRQAKDIPNYLEKYEYTIVPLCNWDVPLTWFSHSEVESLAQLEHEHYWNYMIKKGWKYGPIKDPVLKTNPTLVPWDELKTEEKDKDRHAIRSIPRLYAEIGWRVVKKDDAKCEIMNVSGRIALQNE
jgi:hypothetical protein